MQLCTWTGDAGRLAEAAQLSCMLNIIKFSNEYIRFTNRYTKGRYPVGF